MGPPSNRGKAWLGKTSLHFGGEFATKGLHAGANIRQNPLFLGQFMSLTPSFFKTPSYALGAFWAVLTCLMSAGNDVFMVLAGDRLDPTQVAFCRCLLNVVWVLPFMFYAGVDSFKTSNPSLHVWRAIVGVAAIASAAYSVKLLNLADVTTLFFTQPLFFLPLAVIFLKEHVHFKRWLAVGIGFLGILIMVRPDAETFKLAALIPIMGAILFAILDILAKKMVARENYMGMLFYFGLGTAAAGLIPAIWVWQWPTAMEWFWLLCLGAGGNLIQLFLFQAFSATSASSLAPFRYVELLFSTTFGYVLFGQTLALKTLWGALFIIAATLYNTYAQKTQK